MFSVVVQPFVKKGIPCPGIFRKQNINAPNIASGTEPARNPAPSGRNSKLRNRRPSLRSRSVRTVSLKLTAR